MEKAKSGCKYFFSGILNFQNGIKIIKTRPILKEAIKIGGTELFKASLATGKALPWVAIINNNTNKCLKGTI